MFVCAAVVGPANNPLHLVSLTGAPEEDPLRLHYMVHCALDVVDERLGTTGTASTSGASPAATGVARAAASTDPYLGMLYPTEDYRVYGYVTNTRVKFLLVVEEQPDTKPPEVREVFRKLHSAYVDAVANPFHIQGQPLTSPVFAARVRSICSR